MHGMLLIIERDLKKIRRYKFFITMRYTWFIIQVLVFGLAISKIVNLTDFYRFYLIGVYSSILFIMSIYTGYDIVSEAEYGLFDYYLSLPIPRKEFVLGKIIGSGLSSLIYSTPMLITILMLIGVKSLVNIILALTSALLFSLGISGLIITITMMIKSGDISDILFGAISTLLVRLSTAYYPLAVMPDYYRIPASVNPLSHVAELLRFLLIGEYYSFTPEVAVILLVGLAVSMSSIASIIIERVIEGGVWR